MKIFYTAGYFMSNLYSNKYQRRPLIVNKIGKIMKFTCLFFFMSIWASMASIHSQSSAVLKLHIAEGTVSDVLKDIEKQSDYIFVYNVDEKNLSDNVSINFTNKTIEDVLNHIFLNKNIAYKITNKHISLYKKEAITNPKSQPNQTKKVVGIVLDEFGVPIIGANIFVKGTSLGTITDMDGNFTLDIPEKAILIISYIGYTDKSVLVGNQKNLSIKMVEDTQALDEVVVIGYGTARKSDLTGAVGSVSMKDVSKVGITSADRALQGQVAGVVVNQKTGQPGEGMSIRIRGGNSLSGGNDPLYVIDGMPIDGMSSNINPEDILSMEVLKDASSTAIYGSRGANGVVLITTKRGKEQRTSVTYNGYAGISQLRNKLDLLGKDDYIAMVNEVGMNDGIGIQITPQQAALLPDNDWQDLTYRNALTHSHQLSVSGGTEKTKLYSSLNYLNQEGIVRGSDYNRFSMRINGDQEISNKVSLTANIAYTYGTQNSANSNADGGGAITYTAMVMPPIASVLDEDGEYTTFSGTPWGGTNPVGMSELYQSTSVNSKLLTNLALNYEIIDGLNLRVTAGAEVNASSGDSYVPIGVVTGGAIDGQASKSKSNSYSIINENILTFNKKFNDKHALNVMGGVTFQTYQYDNLGGSATGFLRDVYETNNLGAGSVPGKPSSGFSDYKMASFLGRINYNFMERYLFTLTARYDGSSKFSKNNKFAFFPSAAFAWRVSEENFMKQIDWISNLKLRASIGQTGNQGIGAYATQAMLGTSTPVFENGKDVGFGLSRMANNDLKWETTTQMDFGMDIGFIDNRISLSLDYYWKQTRDLLYNSKLPPSSGYSSMLRNVGRIDNKGLELSINTINLKGVVNWSTNLNISGNRSKVIDLGVDVQGNAIERIDAPVAGGNWFPLFVGKAPFQLLGYEVDGIYQTDEEARQNGEATKKAGDYKYKDTDGQAGITAGDKTIISNLEPKFTFGMTNIVSWNNFELSFLMIGSVGNDIVNEFNKSITNLGGSWNVTQDAWDNRWQEGKGGAYARASSDTKNYLSFGDPSSVWVEDGSYLRLKDIKFQYTLPSSWFKGPNKPNVSVYLSGQNLLTITNYSHYDPEASWTSSAINGWDRGVYPSSKSYTMGVQVNF